MKCALIRVPGKFWEGGRERPRRENSRGRGGGLAVDAVDGLAGEERRREREGSGFESPNSCRTREFQEPGRSSEPDP